MRTAAHPSDLAAAAQAMLAPVKTASRDQIRVTLRTKCPRFVPSSAPVLPFMSPLYWARRAVENVPHVETIGADGSVVALEASVSVASKNDRVAA